MAKGIKKPTSYQKTATEYKEIDKNKKDFL